MADGVLSTLLDEVRAWVQGPCTALDDMGDLISGLNFASRMMDTALNVPSYSRARERLRGAMRRVHRITEVLGTAQGLCDDFSSVEKIRRAVESLRRIGSVGTDPQGAARAFGDLLSGLGELSSHLPPPANSYAEWLAQSGDFFVNMLAQMGPHRSGDRATDRCAFQNICH